MIVQDEVKKGIKFAEKLKEIGNLEIENGMHWLTIYSTMIALGVKQLEYMGGKTFAVEVLKDVAQKIETSKNEEKGHDISDPKGPV